MGRTTKTFEERIQMMDQKEQEMSENASTGLFQSARSLRKFWAVLSKMKSCQSWRGFCECRNGTGITFPTR